MSPTLTEPEVDEQTLFHLEEQFNEDANCQMNHKIPGVPPCTVTVVAIGVCCAAQVRLCQSAAVTAILYMAIGNKCLWCELPAKECWKISPA